MTRGLVLALASGVALGGITSFASLAYGNGATVAGLMVARGLFATLLVAAYCRFLGESLVPERGGPGYGYGYGLAIGIAIATMGFGYMGAVVFITPGLAVALLYIYPVLVLAGESALRRQWPDLPTALAFGLALAGITASVGVELDGLDWRGVALGLAAAAGMAAMLLLTAASGRRGHGMSVLVPAQGVTLLAGLGFLVVAGGGGGPFGAGQAGAGFTALAALLYGIGLLLSFIAVRIAPAPKVALMMNIEPVTTLLAARVLVGEELSAVQYAGILVAVAGIAVGGMLGRGREAATRTGAGRLGGQRGGGGAPPPAAIR